MSNAQMALLISAITYTKFAFNLDQIVSRAELIKVALDEMEN